MLLVTEHNPAYPVRYTAAYTITHQHEGHILVYFSFILLNSLVISPNY
jgi:hypothetical protein